MTESKKTYPRRRQKRLTGGFFIEIVLRAGLEPAQAFAYNILSVACLPFHHPSFLRSCKNKICKNYFYMRRRPGSNRRITILQIAALTTSPLRQRGLVPSSNFCYFSILSIFCLLISPISILKLKKGIMPNFE